MTIFMGIRKRTQFKYDLTPAFAVEIGDSVYVSQVSFRCRFGTVKILNISILLPTLHKCGSYKRMKALEDCLKDETEFLGLLPCSTHVLQPLDTTFFRPMKAQYHKKASDWIHRNQPQMS